MQFIFPGFLLALLAIAIPIIIHLFYFRRFKKVYFTNVKFLKEIKEETSTRNKLRNLLILLMRILAIAFLVLAFAQPFIPLEEDVKKGEKSIAIFVDNSFSMSALSEDVPLIDKAKQRAREIISAFSVEDRFQILTNDFEGRHQRLVSKEDALGMVDEIKVSPAVKELSKVLFRQQQVLNQVNSKNKMSYLISDFQKNITDIKSFQDTTIEVNLIPLQSVKERNVSIDSVWFESPVQMVNQTNPLIAKVSNYSNEDVENIRLALKHEGQTKPVGILTIPANSSVTDTVNITVLKTGWHESELQITDYPVQFDDNYFFTFYVAKEINVLAINELSSNKYIKSAFKGNNHFKLTEQLSRNLDYSKFSDYQMIITADLKNISSGLGFELNQYVKNGGNLLTFPAHDANLESYNSFLKGFPSNEIVEYQVKTRNVGKINTSEFVFKDVFENKNANLKLPVSQGNFKLTRFNSRKEEPILSYRDGTTYFGKYKSGQGNFYFCSSPIAEEQNSLVKNGEIFIPMIYKIAISSGKNNKIAYFIGKDELVEAENHNKGQEIAYKLKGTKNEFIPEQRIITSKVILNTNNQIKEAGYYNLFLNENEILSKFAFNYNRKESQLDYFTPSELKATLKTKFNIFDSQATADFGEIIQEHSRGIILWRWSLILALIFLLLESLIIRLWK